VAIDSTSGFEPFDVALALHRMWGVGQKGRDNGIVVLWVPTQRAVQVSVGYGLEGVLPDSRVGRIRDQVIFPAFRRGEFDAGMLGGVEAISTIAREETDARGSTMSSTNPPPNGRPLVESESGRTVGRRTGIVFGAMGGFLALAGGAAGVAAYRRRRSRAVPERPRQDGSSRRAGRRRAPRPRPTARGAAQERELRRVGVPHVSVRVDRPAQGLVQPLLEMPVVPAPYAGDGDTNTGPCDDESRGHRGSDRALRELRLGSHVHADDPTRTGQLRRLRRLRRLRQVGRRRRRRREQLRRGSAGGGGAGGHY
jgi:uncharacterized membrane protein YgcG